MIFRVAFFCILTYLIPSFGQSQGRLMLVGGGGENYNSWSDTPYQWAIQQAANKKVAIVSYGDADNWLPNYFKSLGAMAADNIKIATREMANQQSMYDSLNGYDMLFFKGGDQSIYYQYFKGTITQEAIETIYERGGVIAGTSAGMAILSGVIFSAENANVSPLNGLSDIFTNDYTLENDFLKFYPDYLFDTHFMERGRHARLLGFMANWNLVDHSPLVGLGVDDRTAFCIDSIGLATVYGTGAVSIYQSEYWKSKNNRPQARNIKSEQLTHGHQFNMIQKKTIARTLASESVISHLGEPNPRHIILSNSSNINQNVSYFNNYLSLCDPESRITIVTQSDTTLASNFKIQLSSSTTQAIDIVRAIEENNLADKALLRNNIKQSGILIFINVGLELMNFIEGGSTGDLIKEHCKRNGIVSFFTADNAPLAGAWFVNNIYSDPLKAYYGGLTFGKGMGILENSVVVNKAFDNGNADFYENSATSILTTILEKQLNYGVYLSGNTHLLYSYNSEESFFYADGSASVMVVENPETRYQQTNQAVNGSGDSRQQYGFDSLYYHLIYQDSLTTGQVRFLEQEKYELENVLGLFSAESDFSEIIYYPNPTSQFLTIDPLHQHINIILMSLDGRIMINEDINSKTLINIEHLANAWYILKVSKDYTDKINFYKILKL